MQANIEEYPLTKVKISDLKPDPDNPNRLNKEQISGLRKAMEKFGYLVPIIINENMEVGDGSHRVELYKAMGIEEIPAYIVPKINNDIERRLLRQTMNKLRGEHDIKLDADEMALIFEAGQLNNLAELIAQERESLENILTKHKGIMFQHEDNFDVDKALEDLVPETKLGDIWQLGNHRIICADSSDERSIIKLIEEKQINALLTDPPYGIDLDTDFSKIEGSAKSIGRQNNIQGNKYDRIIGDSENFDAKPVIDLFKAVKEQFWFGADYYVDTLPNYGKDGSWIVWDKREDEAKAEAIGASFELCWSKQKHKRLVLRHDWFGFLSHESPNEARNRMHPTQKPIILFSDILHRWSNEGDIIIDPFLGSGSTMIACEQTNRICRGVEIDPHYVDVCVKRYEAYTGSKAKKVLTTTEQEAAVI